MSVKNISVERTYVAEINGNVCVNCGMCEEYCPVDAISEKQKAVCHLCPECTEMKALTSNQITDMQVDSCTLACPLGLSPQGYINLLNAGRKQEAFQLIFDKVPLPTICGYVCHHPCEAACKRGTIVDWPMEIRALKRYLSEEFIDYTPAPYPVTKQERIAIVGAGPAGLTAAHWLSKRGYKVTVFEENAEPGGMMIDGIPAFRLDKELARKDIERLEKAGIEIRCNVRVGTSPSIDDLLKDFDRIVVAAGRPESRRLSLDGNQKERLYTAVDFMRRFNNGQVVDVSGDGIVLGGGSVAIDTARAALRMGAKKVTVLCLESGDAIPAHKWELEEAKEEGIEIIEGVSTTEFLGHTVEGVRYVEVENLDPETYHFDIKPNSEKTLPANFIITAIGQKGDFEWEKQDKVYFAGDAAIHKCSVIDAMASGRKAALDIDNELSGRVYSEYEVERTVEAGDLAYKVYPAVRKKLLFGKPVMQSPEERLKNFDLVEKTFTDEQAMLETYRCLSCGYREVDATVCIGCGVCVKVCPKGDVIALVAATPEMEDN